MDFKHYQGSSLQRRIFEILEVANPGDRASAIFDLSLLMLIMANLAAMTLETVNSYSEHYQIYFDAFEIFSVIVFSLEYLLRLWVSPIAPQFRHPVLGRIRFLLTPLSMIDLLAIAPFYLPLFIPMDMRFIRFVRLLRVLRLLKISRYFRPFQVLGNIFKTKREELLITLCAVLILLWVSSTLMYFIEHEAQPEAFSSIPNTMWWGVATLTTVGYGDVYPITSAGRVLGSVISILGIGLFALPTGILASGFTEELDRERAQARRNPDLKVSPNTCPHCGRELKP